MKSAKVVVKNCGLCWPLETKFVVYVLLPSGDYFPEMLHKTDVAV